MIAVEKSARLPLYLQIARAIADSIRYGRLRPGQALPGSRSLARDLGVNRNTVLSAYLELAAQGWVTGRRASGTFVADDFPPARGKPSMPDPVRRPGFDLPKQLRHEVMSSPEPGVLTLIRGMPDPRLFPIDELGRAYRRVLQRESRRLLTYGDQHGHPALRHELARMLAEARGMGVTPREILVTHGSQHALDLIARALVKPGDVVVVEELSHPGVSAAFSLAGARLIGVSLDDKGARIDHFEEILNLHRVRAAVFTPHHQFPTTVVMPASRRMALLDLAARHRVAIIEDDYDHEFHYEARPVLPLASVDRSGVVVYVGTLSKVLAPGLRVGYVAAPAPVIDRLVGVRAIGDIQGDHVMEAAVADMLFSGELDRHVRRMRRVYRSRRDALLAALRAHLPGVLDARTPAGGTAVWARLRRDVDVDGWSQNGAGLRVSFRSGRFYSVAGNEVDALRLGFTLHDEEELTCAVQRMAAGLPVSR